MLWIDTAKIGNSFEKMDNRLKIKLSDDDLNARIERACQYFKEGYNCSQSVVAAFADLYGFTHEQSLLMSASFGGGIGRMRQTCGTACGMFLLVGLDCGTTDGSDRVGKSHNYAQVQRLAEQFKSQTGSLICAELLGLKNPKITSQAEERTTEYYQKRPCPLMVRTAATIFANYLREKYG